jgi:hypothetical protein
MEFAPLPGWAIIPAAIKLVGASVAHPGSAKQIVADPTTHKVTVLSLGENGSSGRDPSPAPATSAR